MSKEDFQINNYFKPSPDEVTENSAAYDWLVRELVDNDDDYFWLSDKLAEAEIKLVNEFGCVDSTRASLVTEGGGWSEWFASRVTCCGQYHSKIINPSTGNSFWIGFNYGH